MVHFIFLAMINMTKKIKFFLLFFFTLINSSIAQDYFAFKELCIKSNGVWREYGNGCADKCMIDRGYKACTSEIIFSCDCLKDRCWDGYECIDSDNYQSLARKEEEKLLEEIKETNPELFLDRDILIKRRLQDFATQANNSANNANGADLSNNSALIFSCTSSGGSWQIFNSGCADTCLSQSGPPLCDDIKTESCDCGSDRCWDGVSCILNSEY